MKIVYDSIGELAQTAAMCEEIFKNSNCCFCALLESCDQTFKMGSRAIIRGAMVNTKDGENQ